MIRVLDGVKTGLVLLLVFFIVFNANLKDVTSGDTIAVKHLPASILLEGDLDLNEFGDLRGVYGHGIHYRDGRMLSGFPPLMAFLALPFYIPFILSGLTSPLFLHVAAKIAASSFTAASAALMYLLLREHCVRRDALLLSTSLAFGTCFFSVLSQDLWQHTGAVFFLSIYLLLLHKSKSNINLLIPAGASLGLAVAFRNPVVVYTPVLVGLTWFKSKSVKWSVGFAASLAIPILLLALFNLQVYDSVFGAYERNTSAGKWSVSPQAFLGLLASPSRGLFIYTPFLLFMLLAAKPAFYADRHLASTSILLLLFHTLLYSSFFHWWAGHSYGPRYMSETLPFLVLFLGLGFDGIKHNRFARKIFLFAVAASILIHFIGAFCYDGSWNIGGQAGCSVDECPERLWSLGDSQILFYLKHPRIHVYKWTL